MKMVKPIIGNGSYISPDVHLGENVIVGRNVVIDGQVHIANNVQIGHGVTIEGIVSIDSKTRIDNYSIIRGKVEIGSDNWIYPFCIIGTGPQHLKYPEKSSADFSLNKGKIVIGSYNKIREYTTIHLPTIEEKTIIGSNCYIMAYCHIAHDSIIHDSVIMANEATLGGHVEVHKYANIGLNVAVHQFCKIGAYSMVGMGNTVVKDVLPFSVLIKQIFSKINKIGMQRNNIKEEDILAIENFYKKFDIASSSSKIWYEKEIKSFVNSSKRGYYFPEFGQI